MKRFDSYPTHVLSHFFFLIESFSLYSSQEVRESAFKFRDSEVRHFGCRQQFQTPQGSAADGTQVLPSHEMGAPAWGALGADCTTPRHARRTASFSPLLTRLDGSCRHANPGTALGAGGASRRLVLDLPASPQRRVTPRAYLESGTNSTSTNNVVLLPTSSCTREQLQQLRECQMACRVCLIFSGGSPRLWGAEQSRVWESNGIWRGRVREA